MSFEVPRTYQRDFLFAMFILIQNIRCKVGYCSIISTFHVDSCYFSTTVNRIRYSYRHRSLSHLSLSSLYLSSLPFSLHLFFFAHHNYIFGSYTNTRTYTCTIFLCSFLPNFPLCLPLLSFIFLSRFWK